jgi:hypothetical protein
MLAAVRPSKLRSVARLISHCSPQPSDQTGRRCALRRVFETVAFGIPWRSGYRGARTVSGATGLPAQLVSFELFGWQRAFLHRVSAAVLRLSTSSQRDPEEPEVDAARRGSFEKSGESGAPTSRSKLSAKKRLSAGPSFLKANLNQRLKTQGRDPCWPRPSPSPVSSFRGQPPRTPRERPLRRLHNKLC